MTPEDYMRQALDLAVEASEVREVPVGAVIVKDGEIIGRGRNRTFETKNPLAHAEMIAMTEALENIGGWRLVDCDMYVTLEPCSMCAGAIVHSRLRKVYIGTPDSKAGACGSVLDITGEKRLNHQPEIEIGILQPECERILKEFFKKLRGKKGGTEDEKNREYFDTIASDSDAFL